MRLDAAQHVNGLILLCDRLAKRNKIRQSDGLMRFGRRPSVPPMPSIERGHVPWKCI